MGIWGMCLLIIGVILVALMTHPDFITLGWDIVSVYLGSFSQFENISLITAGQNILLFAAIDLVLSFLILYLIKPKKEENSLVHFTGIFNNGPVDFYFLITLEEAFRYLFVVIIAMKWLHTTSLWVIVFMLIGNIIWALLHLFNYKNPEDRKVKLVLPQFITGLLYFYILIRYGFFITLIVHLTFDFIILSSEKLQDNTTAKIINFVYWLVVGGIAWWLMATLNLSFAPIIALLASPVIIAPELGIFEMAILLIAVEAVLMLISNFLLLDDVSTPKNDNKATPSLGDWLVAIAGITTIYIGIIYGLTWLLGHWVINPYTTALIVSMLMIFFSSPKSGSAMANLWFFSSPTTFIYVFVALAFGFWPSLAILGITLFITSIPILFMYY